MGLSFAIHRKNGSWPCHNPLYAEEVQRCVKGKNPYLFRAENLPDACVYSWKMLSFQNNPELPLSTFLTKWTVLLICISILFSAPLQMLLPKLKRYLYSEEIHGADFLLIPFLLILSIVMLTGNTYNPFIYFRF